MKQPLFTRPDAWSGGYIEAAALIEHNDPNAERLVARLWSTDILEGPYPSRSVEPNTQDALEPGSTEDPCQMLYGVLRIQETTALPFLYQGIEDEHGLWVTLDVPVGSLPDGWGLRGYPFVSDDAFSLEPLYETFRFLAKYLSEVVVVRGAVMGWLTTLEYDSLMEIIAGAPVPSKRWHGYLLFQPDVVFFPPNATDPLITIGDDGG